MNDSLDLAEASGDLWWEAELHRLRGTTLLSMSSKNGAEAENCFRKAMDVAGQQDARSLELRAATSLAQHWRRQNKHDHAKDLLIPIYDWFTEGFDTSDLKEAKVLLDTLQSS